MVEAEGEDGLDSQRGVMVSVTLRKRSRFMYEERLFHGFCVLYNLTLLVRCVRLLLAIPNHVRECRRLVGFHDQIVLSRWLLGLHHF